MKLEVLVHSKVEQRIPARFVKNILETAANYFKRPAKGSLSVIFISNKEMRVLNRTYRGKDKVTNVLSFSNTTPNSKLVIHNSQDLGDIFICYSEAKREAKKYHFTLRQELDRLLVHGFLHLMGYDHVTEREAKKMEKLEQKFLISN